MTWLLGGEKRTPVSTGSGEKDRFTTQLLILKSKKNNKLKPAIIWKAAPMPPNGKPRSNTVAYEILH
eukprot:15325219-Ditylum_brightwellii.AAC.1